jgi:hypothetical protein
LQIKDLESIDKKLVKSGQRSMTSDAVAKEVAILQRFKAELEAGRNARALNATPLMGWSRMTWAMPSGP